ARARALGVTLPDAFDGWFAKATAVAPEERFATALQLVENLRTAMRQVPPQETEATAAHAEEALVVEAPPLSATQPVQAPSAPAQPEAARNMTAVWPPKTSPQGER